MNILLRLSWCLPQEVKRVEVTCHLMYADVSHISFYTFCMKMWVAYGVWHCLYVRCEPVRKNIGPIQTAITHLRCDTSKLHMFELDAYLASIQPATDGSKSSGGQLWNYKSNSQPERKFGISSTRVFRASRSRASSDSKNAISEVPTTRPLLNSSGWRLCAGSTSRVACKAKPWSWRMRQGGLGMGQKQYLSFIVSRLVDNRSRS